jgi:hypothetical protein
VKVYRERLVDSYGGNLVLVVGLFQKLQEHLIFER